MNLRNTSGEFAPNSKIPSDEISFISPTIGFTPGVVASSKHQLWSRMDEEVDGGIGRKQSEYCLLFLIRNSSWIQDESPRVSSRRILADHIEPSQEREALHE